ncbi:MAG: DNA alkylation repair protein [Rhizobiaceae bacterium]
MSDEGGAPLLKEIFNRQRLEHIAGTATSVSSGFDRKRFMALATENLDALSIMQRMRQVATSLQATLPGDFPRQVELVERMGPLAGHSFAAMALSEHVALYGADHFDRSMQALALLTRYGSSEFAVRHFLQREPERTLRVMTRWAGDPNEHVRRLASEGSRPRLPWSFRIQSLIEDPSPTLPILERLKEDDSLYVRKSVANHLNDIAKDHPGLVLERLEAWPREHRHTAWIVRQALRTLIKQGDAGALALVGAGGSAEVEVTDFSVVPPSLRLGDRLSLAVGIRSTGATTQRLVVDYAIHYVKKSGATSRKVFKLKELDLAAGTSTALSISQVIRDFTTRKHNAGTHRVELMVNGSVLASGAFDLSI